jgi:hypothetical protein
MSEVKEFLNNRNRLGNEGVYTLTSLNGGSWGIVHYDLLKLFEMLQTAYSKNIKKSIGLNETVGDKFNLFLDIEDDRGVVIFDETYLKYIINTVWDILLEICPNCIKDFEGVVVYIARSTAFYNHKLHIVFNGLIVNKPLLVYVIRRLKFLLTEDVAYCIDNKAINGLRMLGSKKYKTGEDCREVDLSKGWYMPSECFSFESGWKSIDKRVTIENLINYSINYLGQTNVYNETTYQLLQKPVITVNRNSLFWKCEMDENRLIENPPKDKSLDGLTIDDWKRIIREIPPAVDTWKWLIIGFLIWSITSGSALDFWIEVSRCEKYPTPEESCRNTWKGFIEDEIKQEKAKSIVRNLVKMENNELLMEILESRNEELKKAQKQHSKDIRDYYDNCGIKIIQDMFDIGGCKMTDRYVDPVIFINSQKVNLLSSSLGSGKTTAIAKYISEKSNRIIWLSPRKTFTDSLMVVIEDLGFTRYDIQKGKIHSNRVVVQWESLFRVETELYKDCILVCDEAESIITQSQSTTNKNNLETNIDKFRELVGLASKVILADAFLSNRVKEIMECIVDPKDILTFDYLSRIRRPLNTFTKKWNKEEKRYITPKEQFWQTFEESYSRGEKIFLFVSSKREGREIHNKHENSILYSSETNNSTREVNELWKGYQLIICTTKITVGIDCQLEFDNVFASIGANILTRDAIQALYRVRRVKGQTYLHLDGRSKRGAISFIRTTLYTEVFSKTRKLMEIISSWINGETKRFSGTVEGLHARMFFVHNLEVAINSKCHENYSMSLFRHQGYTTDYHLDNSANIIFEEDIVPLEDTQKVILIEDYNSIPKISDLEFEKLVSLSKNEVLDSISRAKILKWRVLHYTAFEKHPNRDEAWIEIINNDHIVEKMKSLYDLFTKTREKILEKVPENPIMEDGRVGKKQVFDEFMGWYTASGITFCKDSEIPRSQINEIYKTLEYLDACKEYKFVKYNEKSGDKIKFKRVESYLSSTFNIKLKAGERHRVRDNGKFVDITPWIVGDSGVIGNLLEITNTK